MLKRSFIILVVIFLLGVIFFIGFFVKKERSFNESLRLKQDNEELRAQIQNFQLPIVDDRERRSYLTAKVFSTYPFNIKNRITINVGEKQGIEKFLVAVLKENILIGQVVEVFENYSVIRTIFDSGFQLPVRIGKGEVNAFFQGGAEPKVSLIDKEKSIQSGDIVYSASLEFPYGLRVGEISEVKETSAGVFKEATLKMPFNVSELREVNVLIGDK